MKAIVTGATGFLGSNLINAMISSGEEVIAVVRDPQKIPDSWKNKITILCCDLNEIKDLKKYSVVKDCDVWYHLGWSATSGNGRADVELQLCNVLGTYNALVTADEINCKKFINAGSIMEYEAIQYLSEDNCRPGLGYIYSTAKLCADYMAKTVSYNKKIDYINIVISNIYGIGETSPRFFNSTLRKMIGNEDIPLTEGNQLYDFIYITDAVRKMLFLGKHGTDMQSYYLGNPEQRQLKDFVIEMKKICGSTSKLMFGEVPFNGPFLDYKNIETNKIDKMGCKNEISFYEGVARTISWMKETKEV